MKTHAGMSPADREYRMHLALMASIIYAGAIAKGTVSPPNMPDVLARYIDDAQLLLSLAAGANAYSCLNAALE